MAENLNNSYTQPAAPDAELAADHVIADGVLVLVDPIVGFTPNGRVQAGVTTFLVTDLGAGDVNLVVSPCDSTSDSNLLAGTPVKLVWTKEGMDAAFRSQTFLTVGDEADSLPNSQRGPTSEGPDIFLAQNFF